MKDSQIISVIGAGIMGLVAAYTLKRSAPAAALTVTDPQGFPARNASFFAGGMLAPHSEAEFLPAPFLQAGLKGIELWQQILPALHQPVDFFQKGTLVITHPEDQHMLERFKTHLNANASPKHLDKKTLQETEPALGHKFTSALLLEQEAHINPEQAMHALSHKMAGAVKERAATPHETFDWVVDCRGYAAAADDPDLRGVKGEALLVRNPDFFLTRPVRLIHPRYPLYIVPRADHVFMIGATIVESADEQVSLRSGLELMSALYSLHPSFGEAEILDLRAGIRPAYPDNLPRITVDGNIIRCNGLFRHGYLLAPVMAMCVADYIAGRENGFMHLFLHRHSERAAERSGKRQPDPSPAAQDDDKDKGKKNDHNNQRTEEKLKCRA